MSDQDRPRNPFGRGERTIIRPNPGGRLPPGTPQANPIPPHADAFCTSHSAAAIILS